MEILFIKDYKYGGLTLHKKGETKFINNLDFAKYLINKGVARPSKQ